MRVLGVDPGLTRCGVGVVDGAPGRPPVLVEAGVIRTPALLAFSTGVVPFSAAAQDVALHAMSLPLVIVDPELNLVVDPGVNALVARPNMVSLSQAIMSMLRLLADDEFAARAASRSRELSGQWTIERQATEMLGIYTDLMAERPVALSDYLKPDLGRPRLSGRLH